MELNDTGFKVAVGVGGAVAVALLTYLRFDYELELPAKPPKPQASLASAEAFAESVGKTSSAYESFLKKDAAQFGMYSAPTPDEMSAVFPYQGDDSGTTLKAGESVEMAGLRLTASIEKPVGASRKHLLLTIENLADEYVAYRVATRPTRGRRECDRKTDLVHNAVALAPRQKVRRSECIDRRGNDLKILDVEVVTLPELGYHYANSAAPRLLGLDPLTAAGHEPAVDKLSCSTVVTAKFEKQLESGALRWRDLVDFYARHRCSTYSYPEGYRAFRRPEQAPLPVVSTAP